ncbi:MAG: DUF4062 domain-containing protein [Burkholderiales bacterium]|nr:DUF4062 domain-containing protein [Burkholderiales bacterium]
MKRKLQVFISSTYTDLKTERQAAVGAILKSGHIPAGMELFTSGDKSQMTTIEKWIDESDVYMLILGGRYGSIESSSGLSYTELEYKYASAQGKPMFAVVIETAALEAKIRTFGSEAMEKEQPQLLKQFRECVLSNISSFFTDEKDIKLCVYESLAEFASNPELKGWIAADSTEDTKPLHEEIAKLRSEIERLRTADLTNNSGKKSTTNNQEMKSFEQIEHVLKSIEIIIPLHLLITGFKNATNLLETFYNSREALINGITNRGSESELNLFLVDTVCPKLTIHGLVESERVPGYTFRRFFVTKKGAAFLANFEMKTYPGASNASID